jgi:hypothetical protein
MFWIAFLFYYCEVGRPSQSHSNFIHSSPSGERIRAGGGEQLMLINQLDEDEKNALIKIINSMLTKKRMKDLLDGKVSF